MQMHRGEHTHKDDGKGEMVADDSYMILFLWEGLTFIVLFLLLLFETGFLCVTVLAVLELTL